jgi:hypothetical protein
MENHKEEEEDVYVSYVKSHAAFVAFPSFPVAILFQVYLDTIDATWSH